MKLKPWKVDITFAVEHVSYNVTTTGCAIRKKVYMLTSSLFCGLSLKSLSRSLCPTDEHITPLESNATNHTHICTQTISNIESVHVMLGYNSGAILMLWHDFYSEAMACIFDNNCMSTCVLKYGKSILKPFFSAMQIEISFISAGKMHRQSDVDVNHRILIPNRSQTMHIELFMKVYETVFT